MYRKEKKFLTVAVLIWSLVFEQIAERRMEPIESMDRSGFILKKIDFRDKLKCFLKMVMSTSNKKQQNLIWEVLL